MTHRHTWRLICGSNGFVADGPPQGELGHWCKCGTARLGASKYLRPTTPTDAGPATFMTTRGARAYLDKAARMSAVEFSSLVNEAAVNKRHSDCFAVLMAVQNAFLGSKLLSPKLVRDYLAIADGGT